MKTSDARYLTIRQTAAKGPVPEGLLRRMEKQGRRMTALADALQRREMEQAVPVDGLSRSLFDLQRELAALDDDSKAQPLETMNHPADSETDSLHLTMQKIEYFIADYGRKN